MLPWSWTAAYFEECGSRSIEGNKLLSDGAVTIDDQVVEGNALSILQQLGAVPGPG